MTAAPKKAIATTRSFERMIDDYGELRERVSTFGSLCAEKLRRQNSRCHAIYVFVRSNPFRNDMPQYRNSTLVSLPFATHSSLTISQQALRGLDLIYKSGISYKKAGVMVTGIVPEASHQLTLFEYENPKHQALMQSIDRLHQRFGPHKLKIANQDLSRTYKMKQARLSPRYTTDVRDVICVK